MRITILTLGTRGDVQPYLALGLGLRAAGHDVTLAASLEFEGMIGDCGLAYAPLQVNFREFLAQPDGRAVFGSKLAALRAYRRFARFLPRLLDDAWDASQGAELILFHPKVLNAVDIAEKRNVRVMLAFYLPLFSPTRVFPAPLLPGPANWGGTLNRLTHRAFLSVQTGPFHGALNRWRAARLGLPPRRRWGDPLRANGHPIAKIYGFSPRIVPRPDDWDSTSHVTGHWFLESPAPWTPPRDLLKFLSAGAPPVFVSFGSITGCDPQKTTRTVLAALRESGQRAVLVLGWGGLAKDGLPESVYALDAAPYEWLLPQMAAVVHHGGAGSTAEGLRAGKPTVVCPFFGDQPFWGRRVAALGVGPSPVPQRRLTTPALARAIHAAVTDKGMRQRAEALGAEIRSEDGVQKAVEAIHAELGI